MADAFSTPMSAQQCPPSSAVMGECLWPGRGGINSDVVSPRVSGTIRTTELPLELRQTFLPLNLSKV